MALRTDLPLYLTPPCSEPVKSLIRTGDLGAMATPAQGNRLELSFRTWAADNGVFGDAYPGDDAYIRWLRTLLPYRNTCLFVTAPDVVADHWGTWARSRDMLWRIRDMGFPAALVAQDGMEWETFYIYEDYDVLFIGGTTHWKLSRHAAEQARIACDMGHGLHMGRVNSLQRYLWARDIGCHSVDGTFLVNGPDTNLDRLQNWYQRAAMIPARDPFAERPEQLCLC